MLRYLRDALPGLEQFVGEGEGPTVLDALVDAAEALQVAEVAEAYPNFVSEDDRVRHSSPSASRSVSK